MNAPRWGLFVIRTALLSLRRRPMQRVLGLRLGLRPMRTWNYVYALRRRMVAVESARVPALPYIYFVSIRRTIRRHSPCVGRIPNPHVSRPPSLVRCKVLCALPPAAARLRPAPGSTRPSHRITAIDHRTPSRAPINARRRRAKPPLAVSSSLLSLSALRRPASCSPLHALLVGRRCSKGTGRRFASRLTR